MEIFQFWEWHAGSFLILLVVFIVALNFFWANTLKNFKAHPIEMAGREREVKWTNDALNRAVDWTNGRREALQAELTERDIDLPEEDDALIEAAKQIIADERHAYSVKGCLERFEESLKDEQAKRDLRDNAKESLDAMPGFWRHTAHELRNGFSWVNAAIAFGMVILGIMFIAPLEYELDEYDVVVADLAEQYDAVKDFNPFTDNATVLVDDCPVVIKAKYSSDAQATIVYGDARIANRDYIVLEGDSYVTPCIDK